jgi:hypothetical protein
MDKLDESFAMNAFESGALSDILSMVTVMEWPDGGRTYYFRNTPLMNLGPLALDSRVEGNKVVVTATRKVYALAERNTV